MSAELGATVRPQRRSYVARTAAFAAGSDDPRRFLDECLADLERWEPRIHAFVHLALERARRDADASAQRWKAGAPLSPIDGMPVGIKDIIETADLPTEQGSPLFRGWRTGRDGASVAALREAGAVVVGKTVTTEFAATEPRETCNPWDPARTPGGSSSGSAAAVASGVVAAALGTQVIGSIVRPASFCGCIGFKPSFGAINRGGSYDTLSQSCTGVLAATLDEAWLVAQAIVSRVGADPGARALHGPPQPPGPRAPRALAVLETAGWERADASARSAFAALRTTLAARGVRLVDRHADPRIAAAEAAIAGAMPLSRRINAWESRWPLTSYANDMDPAGLSASMRERLVEARSMSLADYEQLLSERERARAVYAELAAEYDAALTLAATGAAPLGIGSTGDPVFAVPGSLLGVPALSLPLLWCDGLPLGLQLLGFFGADAALFEVASWVNGTA